MSAEVGTRLTKLRRMSIRLAAFLDVAKQPIRRDVIVRGDIKYSTARDVAVIPNHCQYVESSWLKSDGASNSEIGGRAFGLFVFAPKGN